MTTHAETLRRMAERANAAADHFDRPATGSTPAADPGVIANARAGAAAMAAGADALDLLAEAEGAEPVELEIYCADTPMGREPGGDFFAQVFVNTEYPPSLTVGAGYASDRDEAIRLARRDARARLLATALALAAG